MVGWECHTQVESIQAAKSGDSKASDNGCCQPQLIHLTDLCSKTPNFSNGPRLSRAQAFLQGAAISYSCNYCIYTEVYPFSK